MGERASPKGFHQILDVDVSDIQNLFHENVFAKSCVRNFYNIDNKYEYSSTIYP